MTMLMTTTSHVERRVLGVCCIIQNGLTLPASPLSRFLTLLTRRRSEFAVRWNLYNSFLFSPILPSLAILITTIISIWKGGGGGDLQKNFWASQFAVVWERTGCNSTRQERFLLVGVTSDRALFTASRQRTKTRWCMPLTFSPKRAT